MRSHVALPVGGSPEPAWHPGVGTLPCYGMRRTAMKSIALYLLGVPLVVIILLNLFGVL